LSTDDHNVAKFILVNAKKTPQTIDSAARESSESEISKIQKYDSKEALSSMVQSKT
jgi:hypothetical protein